MSDPDYSFLDRVLHRLALHYTPIADVSFDLDQASVHAMYRTFAREGTSSSPVLPAPARRCS